MCRRRTSENLCRGRGRPIVMNYPRVPSLVILVSAVFVSSCRQREIYDRYRAYSRVYLSRALNSDALAWNSHILVNHVTFQPQNHVPRSFPIPSLNTLGSFVFELCCGQTGSQTNKQTEPNIIPTPINNSTQHSKLMDAAFCLKQKRYLSVPMQVTPPSRTINASIIVVILVFIG